MSELEKCPACGGKGLKMQRAARKDANHSEIQKFFESKGYSVLDLSQLKNACDSIAELEYKEKELKQRNKELEAEKQQLRQALENMVNYYIESTDPRDRGLEFPYLQQQAEQLLKGGE